MRSKKDIDDNVDKVSNLICFAIVAGLICWVAYLAYLVLR